MPETDEKMRECARTMLATRDIERLYARTNKLSEAQKSQLEDMLKDAEKAMAQSVWRAYRFIVTAGPEDRLESIDMAVQIQHGDKKISDSIWDALVDKERLAPRIGSSRLMSRDLGLVQEDKQAISTKDVRDAFFTFTYLPMIPSVDVLKDAIVQGVANGHFGYAYGSPEKNEYRSIRIGTTIDGGAIEFIRDAYLLRPEFAYQLLGTIPTGPAGGGKPPSGESGGAPPAPPTGPRGIEQYSSVSVSSENLDWKKWAEFYDAVIQPLVNAGADVKVRVEVEGSSSEGISPNTVDMAVKEGLVQYGIMAEVKPKKKSGDS